MELKRDLTVMSQIMVQKEKELANESPLNLDEEGSMLASGKRFTFDIADTPSDPLR